LAGVCRDYLKKGMKVYIEGQIETRKWTDKDGAERYSTEIVLRQFNGTLVILSEKKKDSEYTAKEYARASGSFDNENPF
ncbi:MAG: single-stranded DNA-binding protein, partial [Aquiluna sp.]